MVYHSCVVALFPGRQWPVLPSLSTLGRHVNLNEGLNARSGGIFATLGRGQFGPECWVVSFMQKKSSQMLFSYWNALRGARSAPDRRDLDPTQIRDALANTFILQSEEDNSYTFRLAGSHLCSTYCRELKSRSFSQLWQAKDTDAIETLIRAVTDDHAVALVTFQGNTATGQHTKFETILMPLRHNGSTSSRILGAMTALDEPYWLGTQPIVEQKISGLRLIWPDDPAVTGANGNDTIVFPDSDTAMAGASGPVAVPARVFGFEARRYAHLAVIDGGRS